MLSGCPNPEHYNTRSSFILAGLTRSLRHCTGGREQLKDGEEKHDLLGARTSSCPSLLFLFESNGKVALQESLLGNLSLFFQVF